jgi:spermidine synthase
MLPGNWMIEFRGIARANMYPIRQTLVHTTSRFQEITIAETLSYGKALFLDGIPQSAQLDEHIYHETLVHPALVAHPAPKSVFIAGGGEGAILREILRHNTIEKIVMVDIDDVLIDIVKEHLPEWHQGAFDHPNVQIVTEDARAYLMNHDDTYDCIYGDLPDPLEDGPAAELFTVEFYELIKSRLNPGGIYALQAEDTEIGWFRAHVAIIRNLQQAFAHVRPYQTVIPFYGLPWGFAVASDSPLDERLTPAAVTQTLAARGCTDLRFYDSETHNHLFSLPRFLRDAFANPNALDELRNALPLKVK